MSTYDMILQKGMQKGMQKGEKRTTILLVNMMEASQMPLSQIAELFEMELNWVSMINDKITSGEWSHPKTWTDEKWEAYFEEKNRNKTRN